MITLSASGLVFIYVIVFLAGILLLWITSEMARIQRKANANRQRIHCMICAMEYGDVSSDSLPCCPRCGSRNERHAQ